MHRGGLRQRDQENAGELRIAQPIEQAQDLLGLGGSRLAVQFALVGFRCVEQEQRVAGRSRVENNKLVLPLRYLAGKGAEHRDFLGAGGPKILLQQRPAGFVHRRSRRGENVLPIRFGLCNRVNAANRQSRHFAGQGFGDMRRRIGCREMHGVPALRQSDGNRRCDGGLSNSAFAHCHDDTTPRGGKVGDQIVHPAELGRPPGLAAAENFETARLLKNRAQPLDAKNIPGP